MDAGVHIGVQLADGLLQVSVVNRVIALEDRHGFVPGDRHNAEVVHARTSHVGHERMAEVMKYRVSDIRRPTGRLKRTPH